MAFRVQVKRCGRCEKNLKADFFHASRWTKDGLKNYCKSCCREYQAERSRKFGVKKKVRPSMFGPEGKECLECLIIKPLEMFSPSARGLAGRASYCKPCLSKRHTKDRKKHAASVYAWREKNRAKYLIQHRAAQVRRRFRKANLDSGLVTVAFVKEKISETVCSYCQKEIPLGERTLDHVVPLNRNGRHHPDNLAMACRSCNSSKSDKLLEEWNGFQSSGSF